MRIELDCGEIRHVRIQIFSCKNEKFLITSASYALLKFGEDNPEAEGPCEIDEHIIDALISPNSRGVYKLKITYHIADETIIEIVEVHVK